MATVLKHLPQGFARTLRWNDAGGMTHLAVRCLPALYGGLCEPTARAVAARYDVNKDTAAKALRSLEFSGLLRRWRRSAGRGIWVHFAFLTDEPFAWLDDAAVVEEMARTEREVLQRVREHGYVEDDELLPTVPGAEPVDNLPEGPSTASVSCPTSSDVPIKDSSKETYLVPTVDIPPVDDHTTRLVGLFCREPELEPYMAPALALLHGLGFAPVQRVSGGLVLATAMRRGRTLKSLLTYLTNGMKGVRDTAAVMRWRLDRLSAKLSAETGAGE